MQEWVVINKKADFKEIGKKFNIDQVTARIIRNRDVIEDQDIDMFLNGNLENLHSPHLLKDADKLVDILQEKIKEKKKIRVIGDYDIDGVMSTFILTRALKKCGADVSYMIPDRVKDGYGLNVDLIDKAYEDEVDTIITCDNGIAAIEEIAHGKELGMTILVTDHHEIPYEITDEGKKYIFSQADAIVNPHRPDCLYPYKMLCGAAVAWKVVILLYGRYGKSFKEACQFIENVGFATVGDVMPLTGENRILVKEGLKAINLSQNTGMRALIEKCQLSDRKIESYHIGFVLGPCINATGRLDTAKRAIALLLTEKQEEAGRIAQELKDLNDRRKDLTVQGTEEAVRIYEENNYDRDTVIVLYMPQVHESIAGIIAGRIREKYNKPTFVLTRAEEGVKGSGRSIENYSMYDEMCKCRELFTKFGGHPMAAGLSLEEKNVDLFRKKINELSPLTAGDLVQKIKIDVPMPLSYVNMDLIREFEKLAPFGKDNPRPVFADRQIRIRRMWLVGKNQNVLKLGLITSAGGPVEGIYFGDTEAFFRFIIEKYSLEDYQAALNGRPNNIVMSVIYSPKINIFRDIESLQFEIQYYK